MNVSDRRDLTSPPQSPRPTAETDHIAGYHFKHMSRVHSGFHGSEDPLWFKDAILYELHVKAFFDSNDDGIGDFRGLIEKLDYIQELGVTAIWLLPTFPSPQRDDGYDMDAYELMLGVGNLCIGADNNPRYDARHMVELVIAGLRLRQGEPPASSSRDEAENAATLSGDCH